MPMAVCGILFGFGVVLLVIMGLLPEPADGGLFRLDPRISLMMLGLVFLSVGGGGLARMLAVKNGWFMWWDD